MSTTRHVGGWELSVCTAAWWKLVLVGAALVVVVIVGAGAGIDAWFLGFVAVMLACLSVAVGLLLGLTHLVVLRRSGPGT